MEWILNNIEWIFSGIGVFIIGLIISFFRKNGNRKKKNLRMNQKSGSYSNNIQIGGDYKSKD